MLTATTQHMDQQKETDMGTRAEHERVVLRATLAALAAEKRGDEQAYQRERQTVIAHGAAAREARTAERAQDGGR